jgi:molybdopterin-guanine dinucleotide biosynthesis protein A
MMSRERALAGAILCGGASRRMGWDKTQLTIDGTTLLERTVIRLRAVADPVILAAGEKPLKLDACLTVADASPGQGPLGGLVAVLRTTPHQLCAVVAVDMPDLDAGLLRWLADSWGGEDVVVPVSARGPEPLHAVYAVSALPAAEQLLIRAQLSMRTLLAALRVRLVDARAVSRPDVAARFAINLNRPEDVTAWQRDRSGASPPPPA